MATSTFRAVAVLGALGLIASCDSPYTPPPVVRTVTVVPGFATLGSGATRQYFVVASDANGNPIEGRTVYWSVEVNGVATISTTGLVTALPNAGAVNLTTVVRARVDSKFDESNLTVTPSVPASIEIGAIAGTLDAGESAHLTAVVRDANNLVLTGRTVTWVSRDLTAASVTSPTGVLTPVVFNGGGNRVVRIVASIGGVADSIDVTVTPSVISELMIQPRAPFVQPGWTKTLRAEGLTTTAAIATGLSATYTSSVPSVASVTPGGVVTVPAGSSGTTEIIATYGALADTVTLTVDACGAAPPAGTFPLQVRFIGVDAPSPAVAEAFNCAAARIRAIIKDPISLVPLDYTGAQMQNCIDQPTALNDSTSGLIIFAKVDPIDGPGAAIGNSGPCFVRETSRIPVVGVMRIDGADLQALELNGTLGSVILHEMLHVIGIGTSWLDNVRSPRLWTNDVPNPGFLGTRARIACADDNGGATICATHVPIEDCVGILGCGSTRRLTHWREIPFQNELMTGYFPPPAQKTPLSRMTIQALADLGYTVDPHQANDYTAPQPFLMSALQLGPASSRGLALPAPRQPTHAIDAAGRITPLPR